jgi:hypothetical protein
MKRYVNWRILNNRHCSKRLETKSKGSMAEDQPKTKAQPALELAKDNCQELSTDTMEYPLDQAG